MKLPFYTLVGPVLKHNYYSIKHFCSHPFLAVADLYAFMLGLTGVAFSIFDIFMIIKCGPTLPPYLKNVRDDFGKLISPIGERDFKLIALFISLEYYWSLMLGIFSQHPVFYIPFLLFYAFIIIGEFFSLFVRVFTQGFNFNKSSLFTSIFVVYNWLSVFCCFWHKMEYCDY